MFHGWIDSALMIFALTIFVLTISAQ